jgi:PAS domain S-box-containing protein
MTAEGQRAAEGRPEATPGDHLLSSLATLVRWRVLVGAGALGLGVLFRPDVGVVERLSLLGASLGVLAAETALFWALLSTRRFPAAQAWLQALTDAALITVLSAATGGADSQFVLFNIVLVLWAGLVLETTGGLIVAAVAATGYLLLPVLGVPGGALAFIPAASDVAAPVPASPSLVGFLLVLGAAAGTLGERTRLTRHSLDQASREVERARLDTDRILESMGSGVLTLDVSGAVLHLNRAAADLLGAPLTLVRGRSCHEVMGEGQKALLVRVLGTLASGRTLTREEVTLTAADGRRVPVGLSTSFLVDDDGTRRGVIAVFADLSEFKAVEERARRSETLAAIGQLSAGIAHEIRNCLNPISGSVEYLQKELVLTGESAHLMGLIVAECDRLNRFVTELLDYAREPRFLIEAVSVRAMVADALDLARRHPAWRPEIALVMEDDGDGCAARLDREHFKRVLTNLLQNAIEAQDGPGRVTVRIRPEGERRVAVSVHDTGPGIPAEHLPRVIEPFFTTKRGGTGLGLAIAARIVERLGGRLAVTSAPGQGTTFTMTLERELALAHAA